MDDNQLRQILILESCLLRFLQIQLFHQLKVSYFCVCNCFSQIAIDAISHGSYGLRGLFFSTIKLCAAQFIVELK